VGLLAGLSSTTPIRRVDKALDQEEESSGEGQARLAVVLRGLAELSDLPPEPVWIHAVGVTVSTIASHGVT
jgi:hypothetical protein